MQKNKLNMKKEKKSQSQKDKFKINFIIYKDNVFNKCYNRNKQRKDYRYE